MDKDTPSSSFPSIRFRADKTLAQLMDEARLKQGWVTFEEAARILNVNLATIEALITMGHLPVVVSFFGPHLRQQDVLRYTWDQET